VEFLKVNNAIKSLIFTQQSLLEILNELKVQLTTLDTISFQVLNPDIHIGAYSGEKIIIEDVAYLYRGYKVWVNLAELLFCRMLTPKLLNDDRVEITFQKLNLQSSFHSNHQTQKSEKYGVDSLFFHLKKNEEPTFLNAYHKALQSVKIQNRKNILNLGINKGDEFELIVSMLDNAKDINMIGVDFSASAIEVARKRFEKYENIKFFTHDINALDELQLEKSDLIISIGTFQSPNIDYHTLLINLVRNYLSLNGAIILGFPNSRWIDGELIYGAVAPNYNYSEMSLIYKDVIFAKKYLQKKNFRVTITGREYIFLTATKIGSL
jgi:hypothetical protein